MKAEEVHNRFLWLNQQIKELKVPFFPHSVQEDQFLLSFSLMRKVLSKRGDIFFSPIDGFIFVDHKLDFLFEFSWAKHFL